MYQFAVVGVDSRSIYRWVVPVAGQDPTPDNYHAMVRPALHCAMSDFCWPAWSSSCLCPILVQCTGVAVLLLGSYTIYGS